MINQIIAYFDGNEVVDFLVDPYMIISNMYLQKNRLQESMVYLLKAESLIKSLFGELNVRMLEIYSLQIQFSMAGKDYQKAFDIL